MDEICKQYEHDVVYMDEYQVGAEKVGGYAYCQICKQTLGTKELCQIISHLIHKRVLCCAGGEKSLSIWVGNKTTVGKMNSCLT